MACKFSLLSLSALLLLGWADCHSLGWGNCANIKGMASFDKTQYVGKWYINEVFSAINTCMTLTFEEKAGVDNELKMSQGRQLAVVDAVGVDHTSNYAGTAIIGDPEPSEMKIKWPATEWIIGTQSYTVVETDYTTYALTYECRNIGPIRYYSSTILTREPTIDPTVMTEIKQKATDVGIDVGDYVKISQENCTKQGEGIDLNTDISSYNLYGLVSDEKLETIKDKEQLLKEIGVVELPQ